MIKFFSNKTAVLFVYKEIFDYLCESKTKEMKKEFGKWLMDIAKYIATAVIISSVFVDTERTTLYVVATISVVLTLSVGLLLVSDSKTVIRKENKKINRKKK